VYYPDLSVYTLVNAETDVTILTVGWLHKDYSFSQCQLSDAFKSRLLKFCLNPIRFSFGKYVCHLCSNSSSNPVVSGDGLSSELGSAEIIVCGIKGKLYLCPDLIYHYVTEHNYCPPTEFVQAVIQSPLPDDADYYDISRLTSQNPNKSSIEGRIELDENQHISNETMVYNDFYFFRAVLITRNNQKIPLYIWKQRLEAAGGFLFLIDKRVSLTGEFQLLEEEKVLNVETIELL
jgi:hypothetical protein